MMGRMKARKERMERFHTENEEFIILHSGLSRYRTLRAFLIPDLNSEDNYLYDIIVPKRKKETTLSRKEETLKKLKANLNAFTEEEQNELKQEMASQADFLNNPFYYADVCDLLVDLNFKHYLLTEFNGAYADGVRINTTKIGDVPNLIQFGILTMTKLNNPIENKIIIKISWGNALRFYDSFLELDSEQHEIFLAQIKTEKDLHKLLSRIPKIKVQYCLGNILDKNTVVPLHLENFSETKEFFEGLDPVIQQKTKITPINTIDIPMSKPSMKERKPGKIKFVKSLNRNPLRCKSPTKVVASLPSLPQRYIFDKRNFKIPSLRNLFRDEYVHAVIDVEAEDERAIREEQKVEEALRRKQLREEKNLAVLSNAPIVRSTRAAFTAQGPYQSHSLLRTRSQIDNLKQMTCRAMKSGEKESLNRRTASRSGSKTRFSLDFVNAERIRTLYNSYNPKGMVERPASNSQNIPTKIQKEEDIILHNSIVKSMMSKFQINSSQIRIILQQYLYLYRVSRQGFQSHRKTSEKTDAVKVPNIGMIKRFLDMATISEKEVIEYLNYGNFHLLPLEFQIVKVYYKKFRRMSLTILERILFAIEIKAICFEEFCKIHYYILDMRATNEEYIQLCLRFFDPYNSNSIYAEDLFKLLKVCMVKEPEVEKCELLLRAIHSNFLVCNIVQGNLQKFNCQNFESAYREGKMNIRNLMKIIFSQNSFI